MRFCVAHFHLSLGVKNLAMMETIDSEKLAIMLDKALAQRNEPLPVMVQVHTSGEESKCRPTQSEENSQKFICRLTQAYRIFMTFLSALQNALTPTSMGTCT